MERLIKKYGIEPFNKIDGEIRKDTISKYFHTHYGQPYSLVTLFQVVYGGKRPIEINELIEDITGTKRNNYFSSVTLPKLRRMFPNEKFPKKARKARASKLLNRKPKPKKPNCTATHHRVRNPKGKLYAGICIECLKHYECDIEENPASLCVCLECNPNGVSYGEIRSQNQSTFAQASYTNPQKGAQR